LESESVELSDKGAVPRGRAICQLLDKVIDVIGYINEKARESAKGGGVQGVET